MQINFLLKMMNINIGININIHYWVKKMNQLYGVCMDLL